jgi:galactose mutarotase-like enzyme
MGSIILENEYLRVTINAKGAELASIVHKQHQLEYMWNGNPAVWGKHSPLLFPIVGTLKNNQYIFEGKTYQLPRHGFARDKNFAVAEQKAESAIFSLASDDNTLDSYPFPFIFLVKYKLIENTLSVEYEVRNTGSATMYFSVGAHPAFAIPLVKDTNYEDYYLRFDQKESLLRWPISMDGLIENKPLAVKQENHCLPLTKELFSKDALVFKQLKSSVISIQSANTPHGLHFSFPGFPFLGLWAAKGGDFVCIEPWCGIADGVDSNQQLTDKEGIEMLPASESWNRSWRVELF